VWCYPTWKEPCGCPSNRKRHSHSPWRWLWEYISKLAFDVSADHIIALNYVLYKSTIDLLQQFTNQMQRVTLSSSSPSPSGAVSVSSPSGSTSLPVLLITLLASSSLLAASRRVNKPEPKKNIAGPNYQSLTAILLLWLTMP